MKKKNGRRKKNTRTKMQEQKRKNEKKYLEFNGGCGRKKEKLRKCFSTGAKKKEEMSSLYIGSETLFKGLP